MDFSWLPALIAALFGGGFIALILFHKPERQRREGEARKANAEAEEIESRNYRAVIETLQQQYADLACRVRVLERSQKRQERYVRYLLDGIKRLLAQIECSGEDAVWQPEDIDIVYPEEVL